jgi:purine-binding chemotaxis protein CheW
MDKIKQFILFKIEGQSFVVHLESVLRIVRAVSVTPFPNMPDVIEGVMNMQGEVIPVVNLRKRFNFPSRPIEPDDHFIIVKTVRRTVAILVDEVTDIIDSSDEKVVENKMILPGMEQIEGVVKTDQEMIMIQDLERLLSLEEDERLDVSLENSKGVKVS